jgi:hypothetical protein
MGNRLVKKETYNCRGDDKSSRFFFPEADEFLEMGKAVLRKGYTWMDASLTNKLNPQTNKLATRLGAHDTGAIGSTG